MYVYMKLRSETSDWVEGGREGESEENDTS